jgi:hypothetical protein
MEKRPYFIMGDLMANSLIGGLAAVAAMILISSSWMMFIAMIVGMAAGMFISLLLGLLIFIPLFGAMEVMLPAMWNSGQPSGFNIYRTYLQQKVSFWNCRLHAQV